MSVHRMRGPDTRQGCDHVGVRSHGPSVHRRYWFLCFVPRPGQLIADSPTRSMRYCIQANQNCAEKCRQSLVSSAICIFAAAPFAGDLRTFVQRFFTGGHILRVLVSSLHDSWMAGVPGSHEPAGHILDAPVTRLYIPRVPRVPGVTRLTSTRLIRQFPWTAIPAKHYKVTLFPQENSHYYFVMMCTCHSL